MQSTNNNKLVLSVNTIIMLFNESLYNVHTMIVYKLQGKRNKLEFFVFFFIVGQSRVDNIKCFLYLITIIIIITMPTLHTCAYAWLFFAFLFIVQFLTNQIFCIYYFISHSILIGINLKQHTQHKFYLQHNDRSSNYCIDAYTIIYEQPQPFNCLTNKQKEDQNKALNRQKTNSVHQLMMILCQPVN